MANNKEEYYEAFIKSLRVDYSSLQEIISQEKTATKFEFDLCALEIDKLAQHLHGIPHGYDKQPWKIRGDGNCLFRSISVLAFGNPNRHLEIRARIIMEMVINEDWYLDPRHYPKSKGKHNHLQQMALMAPGTLDIEWRVLDDRVLKTAYRKEIMRLTEFNSWGSFWTLMPASSVLRQPIKSLHPNLSHKVNVIIQPRCTANSEILTILWTSSNRNTPDKIDHFVPLFAKENLLKCRHSIESETQCVDPEEHFDIEIEDDIIRNNHDVIQYSDVNDNLLCNPVLFPFKEVSSEFYKAMGRLYMANMARSGKKAIEKSTKGLVGVRRSKLNNLDKSIETLQHKINETRDRKIKAEYQFIRDVGMRLKSGEHIVKTSTLCGEFQNILRDLDSEKIPSLHRIQSIVMYDKLAKYLPVVQVYIFNHAFIMEDRGQNLSKAVESLTLIVSCQSVESLTNNRTAEKLRQKFSSILSYLDTKRDQDTLKAVMATITSTKFTASLQGISNTRSIQRSKDMLPLNLRRFDDVVRTSLTVRNDMDCEAQRKLHLRIIDSRKQKEIKHIMHGRGRRLKKDVYPGLVPALEYIFGKDNKLEAHPRLTDHIMYRTVDNVTSMREARAIMIAAEGSENAPSLSTLYNYTMNFRSASIQAKCHFHGEHNAQISLRRPPRTGVDRFVPNLHWSTANVNLTLDEADLYANETVVDSKDAKAIIIGDQQPVQRCGKSWIRLKYPDHNWDQTRNNAVTPMTHQFIKTLRFPSKLADYECSISREEAAIRMTNGETILLKRTGHGVTLLNISLYEPETVHRCFNEIFMLLAEPCLDAYYRNPQSGKLKSTFIFIVDNGSSEAPSNPSVQMWLVRLLNVLKLKKIVQCSFAEYHSKRNFVERVHASENEALSKHGPFSTKLCHKSAVLHSKEHRENMEAMAHDVKECLVHAIHAGEPLKVFRGIKDSQYVFDDDGKMSEFLRLNEHNKHTSSLNYSMKPNEVTRILHYAWDVDEHFEGSYSSDYDQLMNQIDDVKTSWRDKYTAAFYAATDDLSIRRFEYQPLPDYIRWIDSGELHYMNFKNCKKLENGPWMTNPQLFMPSRVLDLCFKVIPEPPVSVIKDICRLSWVSGDTMQRFYADQRAQEKIQRENDCERVKWLNCELFKTNSKSSLMTMCQKRGLPTDGLKFQLAQRLITDIDEEPAPFVHHDGDINSIPDVRKLLRSHVGILRDILYQHNVNSTGTKDQLILKISFLKERRKEMIHQKERTELISLIKNARELFLAEKVAEMETTLTKRMFSNTSFKKEIVDVPSYLTSENISQFLDKLLEYLSQFETREDDLMNQEPSSMTREKISANPRCENAPEKDMMTNVGCKVLIYWRKREVEGTGWKPGWFAATVTNKFDNEIEVEYSTEPGHFYEVDLTQYIREGIIQLAKSHQRILQDYESAKELGSHVEVFWEKPDKNWPTGWYDAQVQWYDEDDDSVLLVYDEEPECTYEMDLLPAMTRREIRLSTKTYLYSVDES